MTTKTKTSSKKKVASKKATAKKAAPTKRVKIAISSDSHIRVVAGSREPKMPKRKLVKKSIPSGGITAKELCEKTGAQLRTLAAMIRKGFIEIRN
jgi:hypothetical protein